MYVKRVVDDVEAETDVLPAVDWDKQPLGKVRDVVIAASVEVDPSTVREQRKLRNIPRAAPDWSTIPFGCKSDAAIAKEHKSSASVVAIERKKLGIPSYEQYNNMDWSIEVAPTQHDWFVAARFDVTPEKAYVARLIIMARSRTRAGLVESTKIGLAKARANGKQLGRPLAANAPDPATVREMKGRGLSWAQIARKLGCTSSAAQRAFKRNDLMDLENRR